MPAANAPMNSTGCAGLAAALPFHCKKYKASRKSNVTLLVFPHSRIFQKLPSTSVNIATGQSQGKFRQYQNSRNACVEQLCEQSE